VLPAALAELVSYGRMNLEALRYIQAHIDPGPDAYVTGTRSAPSLPGFPAGAVNTIKACIETADDADRPNLRQILLDLQRMHSRLDESVREFLSPELGENSLNADYMVHALDFLARCGATIGLARLPKDAPPLTLELMHNELGLRNIREDDLPEVYAIVARRYRNPDP
jgi:hypothetical protein